MSQERRKVKMTPRQLMQTLSNESTKLEQINRRLNEISMALQEINMALSAANAVQKEKGKIMVPLGAGVLLHAAVQDNENVLFSMPGGVLVTKKIVEIKKTLENRKENLVKVLGETSKERERISSNVNTLEGVLRESQRIAKQNKQT